MNKIIISILSLSFVLAMTFGFMKSKVVDTKTDSATISVFIDPEDNDNDNTGW